MNTKRAFTIPKLAVVIIIVGVVLVYTLRPAYREGIPAEWVHAKTDEMNLVTAVKAYYTEYGHYPITTSNVFGDPDHGASIENSALFNILRAKDDQGNPHKIVFFEGRSVKDPKSPRAGFQDSPEAPHKDCFFDPWGTQYFIIMDTDGDGHIQVDKFYQDFKDKLPAVGVGAFSLGKDLQLGSPSKTYAGSDDVVSWQ